MSLLLEALKRAERQTQGLPAESPPPSSDPEETPAVALVEPAQSHPFPEPSMILEPLPASGPAPSAPRTTPKSLAIGGPPPRRRYLILGGLALAVAALTAGTLLWLERQTAAPSILAQAGHLPLRQAAPAGDSMLPPRPEAFEGMEPATSKSQLPIPARAERSDPPPTPEKPVKSVGTPPLAALQETETQPPAVRRSEQTIIIHPATEAGYAAMVSGNLGTAREHYQQALQNDQRSRDALLGMAVMALREGRREEAARRYEQILALDPRDPDANAGITLLHGALDPVAFESRLKNLMQERGDNAALHHALGSLLARQNRWGEAQESFFRAVILAPLAADYQLNLAVSLDHLGLYVQARTYYRQALDLGKTGAAFSREAVQARIAAIDVLAP